MRQRLFLCLFLAFTFSIFSSILHANTAIKVGTQSIVFEDKARSKKISTTIWYPATSSNQPSEPKGIWQQEPTVPNAQVDLTVATAQHKKLPLIILSHGYQGSPESLSWFAINLAKNGFIVVGLQHNDSGPDGKPYMAHWNRALDVSAVLKELKSSSLANDIDFDRVGMAGYSVGTSTGLWLAGGIASTYERTINPGRQFVPEEEFPDVDSEIANYLQQHTDFNAAKKNYREPLIKSVFLIAPGYGWAFDAKHLTDIKIPVFLVAAENDEMLYPETNAYYFSKYISQSAMKIIPNVGHFVFLNQTKDASDATISSDEKKRIQFLSTLSHISYTQAQREATQKEVGNLAVRFFLTTLQG